MTGVVLRPRTLGHVLAVAGSALVLVAGCSDVDRPGAGEWQVQWDQARRLVPSERDLLDDGRTTCDELLGRLRSELDQLTPAPSEAMEPTLDAWSDRVRTVTFECPSDPIRIDAALTTIRELESEILAALS